MSVQRSRCLLVASALFCLPSFYDATSCFGQESPLPPDVVELFAILGIELDEQGNPLPPQPAPTSPTPPPPTQPIIDPVEDPEGFFASLGIPVGDLTFPPLPPPAPPVPAPVVEPPPRLPSPAEIELFGLLGLEFDEEGNLLPPTPPVPSEPPVTVSPEAIDTEQELLDFFNSIGLEIDEQGNPVPPAPPVSPPPVPMDPSVFFLSLGIPFPALETAPALATSSALSIPEPTSAVLALGLAAGILTRRFQRCSY